jgi:hypothetical protein
VAFQYLHEPTAVHKISCCSMSLATVSSSLHVQRYFDAGTQSCVQRKTARHLPTCLCAQPGTCPPALCRAAGLLGGCGEPPASASLASPLALLLLSLLLSVLALLELLVSALLLLPALLLVLEVLAASAPAACGHDSLSGVHLPAMPGAWRQRQSLARWRI